MMKITPINPFSLDGSPEKNELVSSAIASFKAVHIRYPPHETFLSELDLIRLTGLKTRGYPQTGIRATGPSGAGKSTAAATYVKWLTGQFPNDASVRPVIYVELEAGTTGRGVMSQILKAYEDPFWNKGTEAVLQPRVWDKVNKHGTQLIILDEIQHLKWTYNKDTDATDSIKRFLDGGLVPIALIGVGDDKGNDQTFAKSTQLNSRLQVSHCFKPMLGTPYGFDLFAGYVKSLTSAISDLNIFAEPPDFSAPECLACLYEVTSGIIGRINRLLLPALKTALQRNADTIEYSDLSDAVETFAMLSWDEIKSNPFTRGGQA